MEDNLHAQKSVRSFLCRLSSGHVAKARLLYSLSHVVGSGKKGNNEKLSKELTTQTLVRGLE